MRGGRRRPSGRGAPGTLAASLGSIILGFEVVVVFCCALAFAGLHIVPPLTAYVGGAILCVFTLIGCATARFGGAGLAIGWVVQLAVVLSGILAPAMFVAGGVFAVLWVGAMVVARPIDRQNRLYAAEVDGASDGESE